MAGIGRSLQALPEGIEKAKKALKRQNLTQTALAHEKALASWSTINKFFNGKPVDRAIFMEICETLNLDWQEIALPAEVEEEDTSDELLAAVQHHAQRARLDLEPYILPRIRRTALLEKCLQLIRHSVQRDKQNIIPIIGSAGYGKSTILGSIYDELAAERLSNKSGWIALARCDDLIESVGTFAIELGEKVSGNRESITEIVKRLTAVYGKGVLLLDTLDIVLTKSLVSVLRSLLSEFLEIGTTFVFTCRDQDYSYFFEPYHESFAGFRDRVNSSCRIPPFDDDEVKEAAREFVRLNLRTNTSDNSTDFADKIVALSADSKSLQDITRNPLLLALLCDLFASQGKVPEDLTVSQLYAKYWDWKIAKVRKTSQSLQVCMAKEKLCLEIAELMYNQSSERLRDFIYESNLNLSEIEVLGYSELKSDGVLKEIGGKRIIFFHQTFLEYAIARWLYGTHTGEQARQQLEGELNASETTYSRYYLWTVFRQLLTLVNLSEFQRLAHQFNKTKILPFRSLAFAAVSRSEPESVLVLLSLLEIALSKDYAFQEALLVAVNSAPLRHGERVWQVVVKLLEKVGKELINKATEIAAELLVRLPTHSGFRFQEAIDAVTKRMEGTRVSKDEGYQTFGKLLGTYADKLVLMGEPLIDLEVLCTLKNHYFLFGGNVRSIVINLYLTPDVPTLAQRELLMEISTQPTSESFKEKEKAIALVQRVLPELILSADTLFGQSWFEALYAPLDQGWRSIIAAVVGRKAASDPDLMGILFSHLLGENWSSERGRDFVRSNYLAIEEAIHSGAANSVALLLLEMPIETIISSQVNLLSSLVRTLAESGSGSCCLNPELRLALAEWIVPQVNQYPVELIRAIDALACGSPQVQQRLGQVLEGLLPNLKLEQVNPIIKKLNTIPEQLEPYLHQMIQYKESRLALLKIYRHQAENGSFSVFCNILNFCLDESREVALAASWVVLDLVGNFNSSVSELLRVCVGSPVVGVRQNVLQALISAINSGLAVTEAEMEMVFIQLADELAPEVLLRLYDLVNCFIWHHPSGHHSISLKLAEATFKLTDKLVKQKSKAILDMTARSAFVTLNQITNLEDVRLIPQLSQCTRSLLRATDIGDKIDRLLVTGILNKLAKFDAELLAQIVREDFVTNEGVLPAANLCAVAIAIVHDQGKNAPLLDEILLDERLTEDVKSRILRERGI